MTRNWLAWTGILGALGVAMGAFGAHALALWLPLQSMKIFETAVKFHLFHTLALLGVAILMEVAPAQARGLRLTAWLLLAGIVLFSGGLYGTALSDVNAFRWIVPLGGLAWIGAWAVLAYTFWGVAPAGGQRDSQ